MIFLITPYSLFNDFNKYYNINKDDKIWMLDIPLFYGTRTLIWKFTQLKYNYIKTLMVTYKKKNLKIKKIITNVKYLNQRSVKMYDIYDELLKKIISANTESITFLPYPKNATKFNITIIKKIVNIKRGYFEYPLPRKIKPINLDKFLNVWKKQIKLSINRKYILSERFYEGSLGVDPVDKYIQIVLNTGHIEIPKLTHIIVNFFILIGLNSEAIFEWIYSTMIYLDIWMIKCYMYDVLPIWMGGRATFPPISSSKPILKIHDDGEWVEIWSGLYWRYITSNADMMGKMKYIYLSKWNKKTDVEKTNFLNTAHGYLRDVISNEIIPQDKIIS